MTLSSMIQLLAFLIILLATVKPLGQFMGRVYRGERTFLHPVLSPVERLIYRITGVRPEDEMDWRENVVAMLLFNGLGFLVVYALQRMQDFLPMNPQGLAGVSPDSSFNTAVSFATNTNWQGYRGETTMSYLTQMAGLTVQNFVSAGAGMAVLVLFIRGLVRQSASTLGSFWVDLTRSVVYILLPLSFALALVLVSQGVVQTFSGYATVPFVDGSTDAQGQPIAQQVIAVGPAASQIAIKQLGTNGGGFFNVNSAHPFENPTPFSNLLELLSIILIPAALCYTYGMLVEDTRQGWAILAVMLLIFIPFLLLAVSAEQHGNPAIQACGVDTHPSAGQPGGNMEGKEVRFGVANSALYSVVTTSASCGAVNAMHDSFTPIGGLVPMVNMQLGEVIFGGVGAGLYGMLIMVVLTVFIAGLMVGRTPEYLGKKIQSREVQMTMLYVLAAAASILVFTAISVVAEPGLVGRNNSGAHGLSEILYAFSSATANNGSAFAGLTGGTYWYNTQLGAAMLIGRFMLIVPMLALAGFLAEKKIVPPADGTLPVSGPLFSGLLIGVVLIVGALTFFPVLALGPIVEHFLMGAGALS